jgi:hypothetical protein
VVRVNPLAKASNRRITVYAAVSNKDLVCAAACLLRAHWLTKKPLQAW